MDNTISKDITAYFRAYRTVRTMLATRGYEGLPEMPDLNTFQARYSTCVSNPKCLSYSATRDGLSINVTWSEKNSKATIDELVKEQPEDSLSKHFIVVVCENALKSNVVSAAQQQRAAGYRFELFCLPELQFVVTEHKLVPKHEVLTESEKKEVLERYMTSEDKLPRILVSDPVARFFGVQVGDVMKITRNSETAGRYVTYRAVFNQ